MSGFSKLIHSAPAMRKLLRLHNSWRWHGWVSISRNDELNLIGFLPTLLQVDTFDSPAQAFTSEDGVPNTRGRILGGSSTIKQIRISMSNPRSIRIYDWLQNPSFGWCRESRLPVICFPCMSRMAKLGIFPMPEWSMFVVVCSKFNAFECRLLDGLYGSSLCYLLIRCLPVVFWPCG